MTFPLKINVLNYHLDGYGHVNNARYLEFLEAARWDFFRQHGLHEVLRQAHFVISRINIRYHRAARLGNELHIYSQLYKVQSRQIILKQRILLAENSALCATADITLVPTNADGHVFRLPETLLNPFQQLVEYMRLNTQDDTQNIRF